jgi:Co/Zn/Cd efflux system component
VNRFCKPVDFVLEGVGMKLRIREWIGFVLGVILIVIAFFVFWVSAKSFVEAIAAARSEVAAAIVGAMATVLVGVSAVLLSQAHERRRSREEAHRLRKVEIYQEFISMVTRMIGATNQNLAIKEIDQAELVKYLFRYKSDILLWGSPRVIKAQIGFESDAGKGDLGLLFRAVSELYLAIREDIGLSNSGLNSLELVKLFLNEEARKKLH